MIHETTPCEEPKIFKELEETPESESKPEPVEKDPSEQLNFQNISLDLCYIISVYLRNNELRELTQLCPSLRRNFNSLAWRNVAIVDPEHCARAKLEKQFPGFRIISSSIFRKAHKYQWLKTYEVVHMRFYEIYKSMDSYDFKYIAQTYPKLATLHVGIVTFYELKDSAHIINAKRTTIEIEPEPVWFLRSADLTFDMRIVREMQIYGRINYQSISSLIIDIPPRQQISLTVFKRTISKLTNLRHLEFKPKYFIDPRSYNIIIECFQTLSNLKRLKTQHFVSDDGMFDNTMCCRYAPKVESYELIILQWVHRNLEEPILNNGHSINNRNDSIQLEQILEVENYTVPQVTSVRLHPASENYYDYSFPAPNIVLPNVTEIDASMLPVSLSFSNYLSSHVWPILITKLNLMPTTLDCKLWLLENLSEFLNLEILELKYMLSNSKRIFNRNEILGYYPDFQVEEGPPEMGSVQYNELFNAIQKGKIQFDAETFNPDDQDGMEKLLMQIHKRFWKDSKWNDYMVDDAMAILCIPRGYALYHLNWVRRRVPNTGRLRDPEIWSENSDFGEEQMFEEGERQPESICWYYSFWEAMYDVILNLSMNGKLRLCVLEGPPHAYESPRFNRLVNKAASREASLQLVYVVELEEWITRTRGYCQNPRNNNYAYWRPFCMPIRSTYGIQTPSHYRGFYVDMEGIRYSYCCDKNQ